MTEINMLDSSRSSHLPSSIYSKDFLELVWENGEILVKGGSSNRTRNTPWCIEYSTNPSRNDEDASPAKRARLSTSHSLLDNLPAQRDSDLSSLRQSNGLDSCLQSSQSKSSFKPNDQQLPNVRLVKDSMLAGGAQQPFTTRNNHVRTYSSQQCFPSNPLKKPRMDSTNPSQTPTTNLGCDKKRGRVNFSNFLIPAVFLKSTSHQNNARNASSARVEEIELKAAATSTSNKAPDQPTVIESAKGSHGVTGFQERKSLTATKSNLAPLAEESAEPVVPLDEHSEAVGHSSGLGTHGSHAQYNNQTISSAALRAKGKANSINLCNERASSSVCSLGASNNVPNFGIRNHEDADDSTNLSDNDEEPENIVKEMAARKGNRVKRSRNAEIHNLSERKRRDKINEKIRILKGLIPNCNKKDKASMLDDAIDYLKTLKLQLQIMSMGNGLCMPLMMLPAAAHPQLMGAGMGFRPGTGIPCSPPQFPIPPLPGVTDNRLHQMFGFSNQIPPMPIPNAPFLPIIGNSSTQQPVMATGTATNLANSAQLTSLEVSVPNNSDLYAKAENATKQAESGFPSPQH